MKRLLALLCLIFPLAVSATDTRPVTHAELDGLIRQYLQNHPEAIMDSISALQKRELEKSKKQAASFMKTNHGGLFDDKNTPAAGDLTAPQVTIVEFFDYNCGVCKGMFPAIERLIDDKNNHVRVMFKEFPIFGESSEAIAKIALAVNHIAPEKYFAFHAGLMKLEGHADLPAVRTQLVSLGLDPDAVVREAQKPEWQKAIEQNQHFGEKLGIRGTPTLLIGDELIPHALGYDELQAKIAAQKQAAGGK